MPRFSANISLLYNEIPLEDRFAAAAANDFKADEIQFPYEWPAEKIRALADAADTDIVLFNVPAGNLKGGDIGIVVLPGREEEFRDAVQLAHSYQQEIGAEYIKYALEIFKDDNVTLVMEVVNYEIEPRST